MDENAQGILILIVISVLSALLWHSFKKGNTAHIGAVITSVILFQIVAYIHTGYLDPFFMIAIIVSGVIAMVVSFVVKAVTIKLKKYRETNE